MWITGHYVSFNLRTRKRLAMKKQLYTRKFKMKLTCHKKIVLSFLLCRIIDLFCWCFFRCNYTYFVLYKIDTFRSIFLLKFKGEEERNVRHFCDCREGKLWGLISSKSFQEIQNVVVTATLTDNNAINSAVNCLYLSASF